MSLKIKGKNGSILKWMRYMMPAIHATAKMASPRKAVTTCTGNQNPLNIGTTFTADMGIVEEMIIKKVVKGTTNEPRTVILNLI